MRLLHTGSAIIVGLTLGVAGFMIYHNQVSLPFADVMTTQNPTIEGEISYQIKNDRLIISNKTDTLSGTLKLSVAYDPLTVQLITGEISSSYDYGFDTGNRGMMTIFVDGTLAPGQLLELPLQGDSSNISIVSPIIITTHGSTSLSITRIE